MVLSMSRWVGKVAVVTGASAGIGAAIVDQLVELGVIVVGIARRVDLIEQRAEELSDKDGKLYPYKADLTNQDEILEAFKWIDENVGPVHILINNAGVSKKNLFLEGDIDAWRYVLELNLMSVIVCTREAVRVMRENGINGHIVHINSIYGHTVPSYPGLNMYPLSKHALTVFTESQRREFNAAGLKIKVSSVSPGFVTTEMTSMSPNEAIRDLFSTFPMIKSEDVADAVVYALSTPEDVQVHELTIKPLGEID